MASDESPAVSFEPIFAVEHDQAAALTYQTNFGVQVHSDDIELFDPASYPAADIIVGGPPCQGFSPLGRDRDDKSRARLNSLWEHFLEAVLTVKPLAFVIENVPQFQRSAQFNELRHRMASHPELRRYEYGFGVLNAADYGVPQNRRRGILIATRDCETAWPPRPTHGQPGLPPHRTVRSAIGNLKRRALVDEPTMRPNGTQNLHIRRNPTRMSLERYRAIPPGGNRFDLQARRPDITPPCWTNKPTGTTDVMGRMWWNRPSPTIRTEFFKPEKGRYLHPSEDRPITHLEAARLQTFPDEFVFDGTKIEIARQIGNAVPPILGKAIASHLAEVLTDS